MLEGSLESIALPEVLRLVGTSPLTGRLYVRRKTVTGSFSFAEGIVVNADVEGAPGHDVDAILDAAMTLLEGSDGEFNMATEPVNEAVRFGVQELLDAAKQRGASWRKMAAIIGGLETPPALSANPGGSEAGVTMSALQWQLATLVDGHRAIRDLALDTDLSMFRIATTVVEMMRVGLLVKKAGPTGSDGGLDQAPPAQRKEPRQQAMRSGVIRPRTQKTVARSPAAKVRTYRAQEPRGDQQWITDPSSKVAYPVSARN